MSGLFALLDDVAALVRLSAASLDDVAGAAGRAGAKAAGVVTGAEADQLLARLVLVIDQAVESFP